MKLADLEQYTSLCNEVNQLEERIEKYELREKDIVADTVKDYRYGERVIVIRGYDVRASEKIRKIRQLKEKFKAEIESKLIEIEEFISNIDDSRVRQIIQLRYLDGLAWSVVARKVYGYPCADRARMKARRFFENI